MKKATTILILVCVLATVTAVWWISQLGDEPIAGSDWAPEQTTDEAGAEPAPKVPAATSPAANRRPPNRKPGERVEFESPSERSSTDTATLAEITALIRSTEAPDQLLAIDLLREIDQETAWPLLRELMGSASVQVRAESVELASEFDDENTGAFLAEAVTDASTYVGYTVLEAVEQLPRREREQVRRAAVLNAPAEVATSVLADVEVESTHDSVGIIIEGLNSSVEDTREESREILDFLFDQQFENAGAAEGWWQTNQSKFDRDLVEKE